MRPEFWKSRRVYVTGHTGFKGSWLTCWLYRLGAEAAGYALPPATNPALFEAAGLGRHIRTQFGDIRNLEALTASLQEFQPEIVIHMAAQPLVRQSYADPIETFSTNIMGTANVLQAARQIKSVKVILNVTTDKCYENKEWDWPYRETDRLGGHDPYSSSKACSELVTSAYRDSFFPAAAYEKHGVGIASARAGNVIGGGDWSKDRLIPDLLHAIETGKPVKLRSPNAVRPWQHVLEPLHGYLMLCEKLFAEGDKYSSAWNFGPDENDCKPVSHIASSLLQLADSDTRLELETHPQPHEAGLLKLATNKSKAKLGWRPLLSLDDALKLTVDWHKQKREQKNVFQTTLNQIDDYMLKIETLYDTA